MSGRFSSMFLGRVPWYVLCLATCPTEIAYAMPQENLTFKRNFPQNVPQRELLALKNTPSLKLDICKLGHKQPKEVVAKAKLERPTETLEMLLARDTKFATKFDNRWNWTANASGLSQSEEALFGYFKGANSDFVKAFAQETGTQFFRRTGPWASNTLLRKSIHVGQLGSALDGCLYAVVSPVEFFECKDGPVRG